MYKVPTEARGGCWIPWISSYRQLQAAVWMLETITRSCARVVSVLSIELQDSQICIDHIYIPFFWGGGGETESFVAYISTPNLIQLKT